MKKRTLEERKERANAMLCFLEALPLAKHSPFYEYHALEKVLQRLKAFLRFLTALNPKQYLAWMLKAFSHTAAESTLSAPSEPYTGEEASVSSSLERESVVPPAPRGEKPDRKRLPTPG